jgi:hypothetical protein
MPEKFQQINFDIDGRALAGDYHNPAMQAAIESRVANREVGVTAFQSVVDQESVNGMYVKQYTAVHTYFSARGLAYDPVRIVEAATMDKAYAAAGIRPTDDVESAQGRNVYGRSVVIENLEFQELFGDDYLLGIALHEAAHSLGRKRVITTSREVAVQHSDRQSSTRVVLGGVANAGLIKADLRRDTPNRPIGDFWEEAFADLTRVRALRYLQRSHDIYREPKELQMGNVSVKIVPNQTDKEKYDTTQKSSVIPAEFAAVAKTSAEGRNMVGVAPANLAAYALELLDARMPGLYEDMEAGTRDSSRQAEAIRKIESVQPGLYSQLRELEYTGQDFAQGLNAVIGALTNEKRAN